MTETLGSGPVPPGDHDPDEIPTYRIGENVRIYADRAEGRVPEDDWEYRSYREDIDHEVAAKNTAEAGGTQFVETPKEIFDEWQREKARETLGRLATGKTVDASEDVKDISDDMLLRAQRAHLRIEDLRRALDAGYEDPVEFLIKSRGNANMAARLKIRGYNLSPPPEVAPAAVDSPTEDERILGERRRAELQEIIDNLGTKEGIAEERRRLVRPNHLPLSMESWWPIGKALGDIKLRVTAWRMYRHDRTKGIPHDAGFLGLGLNQISDELDYLRRLDTQISVMRSKMSYMNRHHLNSDMIAPRRDTAQQIVRIHRSLSALADLETLPEGFYEHQPYKDKVGPYNESRDAEAIEHERNEFVKLRNSGVRNEEQERRFREISNKHPDWL